MQQNCLRIIIDSGTEVKVVTKATTPVLSLNVPIEKRRSSTSKSNRKSGLARNNSSNTSRSISTGPEYVAVVGAVAILTALSAAALSKAELAAVIATLAAAEMSLAAKLTEAVFSVAE
jgi:hypothetical protein